MICSAHLIRIALFALVASLGLGCAASVRPYAVDAPLPLRQMDLDVWDGVLREHVRDGRVDYPALCGSPELARFLDQVSRASIDGASRDEGLSFHVNAYNALAIASVLEGARPSSLLGRYEFFLRGRHPVAGEEITLYDLEREVIEAYGEPRSHFVLVCASSSCPVLDSAAIPADALDAWLDAAARRFVNDTTRNRFDMVKGVAELSSIFDWYREEFERAGGTMERFVASYVDDTEVARALRAGELKVRFLDYDWSLNGTPPPGKNGSCPGT